MGSPILCAATRDPGRERELGVAHSRSASGGLPSGNHLPFPWMSLRSSHSQIGGCWDLLIEKPEWF